MAMMTGYKWVDVRNGHPHTLFYGWMPWNKCLPLDEWIVAEKKTVRDGTGGRTYLSGFHVYLNREAALKWPGGKRNERALVRVWMDMVREKEHSPQEIVLSDIIMITSEDWKSALEEHHEYIPEVSEEG